MDAKSLTLIQGTEEWNYRDYEIWRQMRVEFARRAAQEKDVLGWGKAVMPEKFVLPYCQKMHGYFVEIRGEEFTDTEAPRNHAKTAIKCNLIPLYQACEEPETFRHYLNVQATGPKALSVNVAIRNELEHNEIIRALYGDLIGQRWTDQQFVLSNKVIFTALGAGQSVRGINYLNIRPDYILIDDLYDEEHIHNREATIKMNEWFWGSLYPARAKTRRCSVHVQGTAINKYDLMEELKKRRGVSSKTFKAIENTEKKTVLWPELNTFDQLMTDAERMGPIIFAREMQNERRDDKTSILKRSYWKYYKQLPEGFDMVVSSWDMNFQETESGSYVCGQVWGRRGPNFYLFPMMFRERVSFVEALEAIKVLIKRHPMANGHLFENKANGPAVMSVLAKEVPGLIPINPHGSKIARAEAVTPPLAAGNVFIPDPSICPPDPVTGLPWVLEYVEECANMRGGDGETNDQPDTSTQGIFYLMQLRYPSPEEQRSDETFVDLSDDELAGGFTG